MMLDVRPKMLNFAETGDNKPGLPPPMKINRLYPNNINQRVIDEAASLMADGQLIVYPTDTLYALGCSALDSQAIRKLCRAKGLDPEHNTLSAVCADISMASEYVRIDNNAYRIMRACLPGPFTFILPVTTRLPRELRGRKQVGIRVPDNAIALELSRALGHPVLSSSVEPPDPDLSDSVADPFVLSDAYNGVADLMIDGGEGGVVPSTIVDLTDSSNPVILRQGAGEFVY